MAESEFMKVKDIMERLGVSRATAYKIVHSHGLKAIKIGRSVLVRKTDFERYIENSAIGGDAE